jgi:hypothetical protein
MELKQQLNNIHQINNQIKLVKLMMSRQHVDFMNHGIIMIDVIIVNEIRVSSRHILKAINY